MDVQMISAVRHKTQHAETEKNLSEFSKDAQYKLYLVIAFIFTMVTASATLPFRHYLHMTAFPEEVGSDGRSDRGTS